MPFMDLITKEEKDRDDRRNRRQITEDANMTSDGEDNALNEVR